MVLDEHRQAADKFLVPMARKVIGMNPDHLSAAAIILAAVTGILFWLSGRWAWFLLLSFFTLAASSLLDALDGKVARLTGKANERGDFLDHVLDRYADIFLILGIVLSGYCNWFLGLLALTGVFMTSYLGTQAQAVGVKRDYGGILGRADRLVLLMLMPIALWAMLRFWDRSVLFTAPFINLEMTLFDIMLLWFALAGHFTALQRGVRVWKELTERRKQ